MFKHTRFLLVACLVTGTLWAANEPFVGDWKLNPSKSKLTDQMKVESIATNKYSFDFGGGDAEMIAVDGTDQPGNFGTTLCVSIEGPDSWKVVRKKNGRILITATWKLSKDGNTLTDDFTAIQPNRAPFNLKYVYKRMAGTSGFAGTWESTSEAVNSVYVLQVRPYEGEGLSFIDPSQEQTTNVKFDGKDYPNVGPNVAPGSASSVRRVNQNTLEMTDKINGKITDTQQIELSSQLPEITVATRSSRWECAGSRAKHGVLFPFKHEDVRLTSACCVHGYHGEKFDEAKLKALPREF